MLHIFFALFQFIFNKPPFDEYFDQAQKMAGHRSTEVPCWRQGMAATGFSLAGWQRIGIGGRSPAHFTNSHRRKQEKQEVRPNASHSDVSIEQTGNRGRSRCEAVGASVARTGVVDSAAFRARPRSLAQFTVASAPHRA
jgi:hypothetical protein